MTRCERPADGLSREELDALAAEGIQHMEIETMDSKQVSAMITTLIGFLGGYAAAYGFTPDQWVAIGGGVAAAAAWFWDYKFNKKPTV